MNIDISKMGNFLRVTGNSAEIYREDALGITSGGTYRGRMSALGRTEADKAANNAVRSQLLKSLADAVGINGYRVENGRIRFDADFVSRLKNALGRDFAKTLKLDSDFSIDANGCVSSGKPLTERRISSVNRKLRAMAEASVTTGNRDLLKNAGAPASSIREHAASHAAAQTAADRLHGNLIAGAVSKDTLESLVKTLLPEDGKCAHPHMTFEDQTRLREFVGRMVELGVDSKKVAHFAYALTVGLNQLAEKFQADALAALKKDGLSPLMAEPKEPSDPRVGFFGWRVNASSEQIEKYEKDKEAYDKLKERYDTVQKAVNRANDVVKEVLEKLLGHDMESAVRQSRDLDGLDYGFVDVLSVERLCDTLLDRFKAYSDAADPKAWDKTVGVCLSTLDSRLEARAAEETRASGWTFVEKEKSTSEKTAATVRLNASEALESVKAGVLKELGEMGVEIGNLAFQTGDDGKTLNLKVENLAVKMDVLKEKLGTSFGPLESIVNALAQMGGATIPLTFTVDPASGKLAVSVGEVKGESIVDNMKAAIVNNAKPMIGSFLTAKLSEALGAAGYAENPKNAVGVDRVGELHGGKSAPIGLRDYLGTGGPIYTVEIDPARLAPLKAMGFDRDTKFAGIQVKDGVITLQAGGEWKEPAVAELPGSTVSVNADLGGIADRVRHLMAQNGIGVGSLTIAGDPDTQQISVDVRNLNLDQIAKKATFPLSTALKILSKGSYRLKFTPSLDATSGEMTLRIDGVENLRKGHGLQGLGVKIGKRLAGKKVSVIENLLRTCLANVPGIDGDAPAISVAKDPGGSVLTLRTKVTSILKMPEGLAEKTGRDIRPSGLAVSANGLDVGFSVVENYGAMPDDRVLGTKENPAKPFRELAGVGKADDYEAAGMYFLRGVRHEAATARDMKIVSAAMGYVRQGGRGLSGALKESDPTRRALAVHELFKGLIASMHDDKNLDVVLGRNDRNVDAEEYRVRAGAMLNLAGRLIVAELSPEERKSFRDLMTDDRAFQRMLRFDRHLHIEMAENDAAYGFPILAGCLNSFADVLGESESDAFYERVFGAEERLASADGTVHWMASYPEASYYAPPPYEIFRDATKNSVQNEYAALETFMRDEIGPDENRAEESKGKLIRNLMSLVKAPNLAPPTDDEIGELADRFDEILLDGAKRLHVATNGASMRDGFEYDPDQYEPLLGQAAVAILRQMRGIA